MTRSAFRCVWLVIAGLVLCACESSSGLEGRYVSPAADGAMVTLTLQADGKGLWVVDQESTPVRWKKRQGALWLHVRSGGVLIAQLLENEKALSVSLPGGGNFLLKKASD
ncbi:MAG: hypothetical protein KKE00_05285 [Proteobacteria bacterium]|nr:hypothetical protein [Pseudomonadota bacterium]MBU1569921.1 hypothetical protein [Pseudomonadota bacterium]